MVVIIMAGGSGTRFWPLSRRLYPKQFLNIVSDRPMIEETYNRVSSLSKDIFIVSNLRHKNIIENILKGKEVEIISEPFGRNTAPCIGLAAVIVKKRFGDVPMVVLPADHFIDNERVFTAQLRAGVEVAKDGGIVTIGIKPNRPERGYGYIKRGGDEGRIDGYKLYSVERFVEKPDLIKAIEYVRSGEYFWNSGIFIFKVSVILNEIKKYLNKLYDGLIRIGEVIGRDEYSSVLEEVYREAEDISIDYGVMEKTEERVYVIEGEFVWDDVGSWEALYRLRRGEQDENGNLVRGNALMVDTRNTFIYSNSDRLIATLGIKDMIIVEEKDAILITDLRRSQDVKKIVDKLKEKGLEDKL